MAKEDDSRFTVSTLSPTDLFERCALEFANADHYLAVAAFYVQQVERALGHEQINLGVNLAAHWIRRAWRKSPARGATNHQAIEAASANLNLAGAYAQEVHDESALLGNTSHAVLQLRALLVDDVSRILGSIDEARSALESALEQLTVTSDRHSTSALACLSTGLSHLCRAREQAELGNTHVDEFFAARALPRRSCETGSAANEWSVATVPAQISA